MSSSSLILLLCTLALLVVGEPTTSLPVTHAPQEAVDVTFLNEHLAQYSHIVTRYKRAADDIAAVGTVIVTVPITVGGAPFTVLFDTGSALLALPVSTCTTCDADAPHAKLAGATSIPCTTSGCQACCTTAQNCPTTQCSFTVGYADGSGIQGGLIQDSVQMGQLTSTMIFGGITKESAGFTAPLADGIIGFSQSGGGITCAPSCVPTVFDNYVTSKLVPNTFGLYLDFNGGGQLTLGNYDPTLMSGGFTNTSMVGSAFYGINLRSMTINGQVLYSTFGPSILDSGTTQIVLPNAAFNALVAYMQKNYATLPGVTSNPNIFSGQTCLTSSTSVAQFPSLQFAIDGMVVTAPPQGYFLPTTSTTGKTIYCYGIGGGADSIGDTILGYAFQRGKYIFMDRSNHVIQIATGAGTTGSEITPVTASAGSGSGNAGSTGGNVGSDAQLGGGNGGSGASALTVSFALIMLPFFLAFLAL